MHLLPRVTVMLYFIWTLPVQLRGTRYKWTLHKNLVHGRIRTTNTARSPDYKSIDITTRPQLAWYEMELNVHEIYKYTIYEYLKSSMCISRQHLVNFSLNIVKNSTDVISR